MADVRGEADTTDTIETGEASTGDTETASDNIYTSNNIETHLL